MTFHSGKRLRTIKLAATNRCRRRRSAHADSPSQHRTLMDILEPRLLFSAEHPLGMAVGPNDFQEHFAQLRDAEIATVTLDMLHDLERESSENLTGSTLQAGTNKATDEAGISMQSSTSTSDEQSELTIDELTLDDGASIMLADGIDPLVIIHVTTEDDSVDATDMSSLVNFNNGAGGDNLVSLREAIIVANADSSVDSIRLPSGVFSLDMDTGAWNEDNNLGGDLDLSGTYIIQGNGDTETVVEQTINNRRVFELLSGTVTFNDMTIKGGLVTTAEDGSGDFKNGGGVYVLENEVANFKNIIFDDNESLGNGGAIYAAGTANLENVVITASDANKGAAIAVHTNGFVFAEKTEISGNNATDDGGGIYVSGRLELYDSFIDSNNTVSADAADNTRGGAIWIGSNGDVIVENTVISNNFATSDGGGINNFGTLTMTDSIVTNNTTERTGGGLRNVGEATLERVTFWGNSVTGTDILDSGAGIYSKTEGNLTISYSAFIGNNSSSWGGGLSLLRLDSGTNGAVNISDTTIINNTSQATNSGAGILTTHNNVTLTNTLVANNTASGNPNDVRGFGVYTVNSGGFNLVQSPTNFDDKPTDIIGVDPGFSISLDGDGHATISISPTSATIDSGNTAGTGNKTISGSIVGDTPNIGGYTINTQSGMVFWSADSGAIYRSDADFTFSQKIIDGISSPLDIEVDDVNHRVYWLDSDNFEIKSAKYDGSDIIIERKVDIDSVAFALDMTNERFFVATSEGSSRIVQYFKNDVYTNATERNGQLVALADGKPTDIELDQDSDILYWAEDTDNPEEIMSVETRPFGQDPQEPVPQSVASGSTLVKDPYALAINDTNDQVFWSEPDEMHVARFEEGSASSPQVLTVDTPQALAYDTLNDRLIVANDNSEVFWINSTFNTASALVDVPETVARVTFSQILSDEPAANNAPEISSENTGTAIENQTSVLTVTSTDADLDTPTYSIVGGVDAGFFAIDSANGDLTFLVAPNFEVRDDVGANNIYNVDVQVTDGEGGTDTQSIAVTVTDENEDPVFTSAVATDVEENQTSALTLSSTDDDSDIPAYAIVGGVDAGIFLIDSVSGELKFQTEPDFEAPSDANADNTYEVDVQVSDGQGGTDSQSIELKVQDENDDPVLASVVSPADVLENQTSVLTLSSSDDDADTPTYAIAGGVDAGLFAIDSASGELTFQSAPNFESPGDVGAVNTYNVNVQVSDGNGGTDTQSITVSVQDENDDPVLASVTSPTDVLENQTVVLTVNSTDDDADTPTYAIVGGDDAGLFLIDSVSGELTFQSAPNFEAPSDVGADNIYKVDVQVSDGQGGTDTQSITVRVQDENDDPVLVSVTSPTDVLENQTVVLTVNSTDDDADTPTYAIVGGDDAGLFLIDSVSGELTFQSAPNFEAPSDVGADNIYKVDVQVSDGQGGTDTQSITVRVQDENDDPVLASVVSPTDVLENQTRVLTVNSTDDDADTPDYAIAGGVDASLFAIDSVSGELTFQSAPNFEAPSDVGADNTYNVDVQVSDGNGGADTQSITVRVQDENDNPVLASVVSPTDMLENQTRVLTVSSTDDDADTPDYAIVGGVDAGLFTIDSASGELTLQSAPNFEAPSDVGVDNTYNVDVQVSDGQGGTDTQSITVRVQDENDDPVLASVTSPTDVLENQTRVLTVSSTDDDSDTPDYAIVGGVDAGLFTIDSASGELTFQSAPNFETPSDVGADNTYNVDVQVSDGQGGTDTQSITVRVQNENDDPVLASVVSPTDVLENQTRVLTLSSTDDDADTPIYAIVGGVDAGLFAIDSVSGELTFQSAPNFEAPGDVGADNTYNVDVQVSDGQGGTDTQSITVRVQDENDDPVLASVVSPTDVLENQTRVLTISSTDDDADTPDYAIAGGVDAGLFAIDSVSGELTFQSAPNFEAPGDVGADNTYNVDVQVSDGQGGTDTQSITVRVQDENDDPVLASVTSPTDVLENQTRVLTVSSTDDDADTPIYAIVGGVDAGLFAIDSASGELTFQSAPNFESPGDVGAVNTYNVNVQVSDGNGGTDTQSITVSVQDENDDPVLASVTSPTDVLENQTSVLTVSSADDDADTPIYAIVGGVDAGLFTIDSASGELTFQSAPNFEAPSDVGADNTYNLDVQVSDGNGGTDTQSITVNVRDENEAPVLVSVAPPINVVENQTSILTFSSTDQDADSPIYEIIGGIDAGLFTIDSASGELTFQSAPNFEAPGDAGVNNIYEVDVQVSDGQGGADTQSIAVSITDVNEVPVLTSDTANSIAEIQTDVFTVTSENVDGGRPVYSISGGDDAPLFVIDSASGALTFRTAPNFEAPEDSDGNNVYQVTIQVADVDNETATQAVTVTVTDIDEVPVISAAATAMVEENQTTVLTASSSNVDGAVPEYSINSGADALLFAIDPATGALTFRAAPDYEVPTDVDGNNVYEVTIQVADGDNDIVTHSISVTVIDVNEDPVLTSGSSLSTAENQSTIVSITSSDVDGDPASYSIIGGVDADLFAIDSSSGELTFQVLPDFETPRDVDGNNLYDVTIQVADGAGGLSTQAITISVIDENDAPVLNRQLAEQVLDENSVVMVGVDTFSDQDGDALVYSMSLLDGRPLPDWISYDPDTTELRLGVSPSEAESEKLLLTANDSQGGTAGMIFDVRFTPDAEPLLQAAIPTTQPIAAPEFETSNSEISLSLKSSQPTAVSENSYSTSELDLASEDTIEAQASVSAEAITDILSNGYSALFGRDDSAVNQRAVLRDNILSEYLSGRAVEWENGQGEYVKINVFDDSVNIASLFAMAQQQDPEMFSSLSEGFDKQRQELDSQITASRGVIGSAITTTSGLSVGYILYLLRGGAIMSSMLTSLPAWRFVDPLPILGSLDGSGDGDGESLQSIVGGSETKI